MVYSEGRDRRPGYGVQPAGSSDAAYVDREDLSWNSHSGLSQEISYPPNHKARLSDLSSTVASSPTTLKPPPDEANGQAATTKDSSAPSSAISARAAKGSIRLLYASLKKQDGWVLLLGLLLSLLSGALPALMTRVLGDAFDAYTSYNVTGLPSSQVPQVEKDRLLGSMATSAWQLSALGAATMILSTAMISNWIAIGERVAGRLRARVYISVSQRKMEWFDLGMGAEQDNVQQQQAKQVSGKVGECGDDTGTTEGDDDGIGSGGLMAKFARETDDVRIATGQQAGQLVQYLTTALSCLVLALVTNWSLTLVILASIPIAAALTIAVEIISGPLLVAERASVSRACGLVERVVTSIATVKAFNGEKKEALRFEKLIEEGFRLYMRASLWWGVRQGFTAFLMFSMFVQGFWYGSYLVQNGSATAGSVMSVFWAALLASSHLQLCISALNIIEKGKVGAAGLERLIGTDPDDDMTSRPLSSSLHRKKDSLASFTSDTRKNNLTSSRHHSPPATASSTATHFHSSKRSKRAVAMRGIRPRGECHGEVDLRNITFCYPSIKASNPTAPPTLRNVDMFIPAGEATFIVGGSGSGKSTIAQLLLRLYRPDSGAIELDGQDSRFLDRQWCRANVASVDQHPIVFDLSVHDNVALGLIGQGRSDVQVHEGTHVPIVEREQIISACRTALLHEFIKGLPDGYDTILGARGAALSGGQKQRLAIARARLRDPAILILDEATSALDLTSRLLVNEAIKTWRRGKTTIIITHDLSQVEEYDFLYMMKEGEVVEHGYRGTLEQHKDGYFETLARQQKLQEYTESGDQPTYESVLVNPSLPSPEIEICQEISAEEDAGETISAKNRRRLTRRQDLASALGLPQGADKNAFIEALGLRDYRRAGAQSSSTTLEATSDNGLEDTGRSSLSATRKYRSPFTYTRSTAQVSPSSPDTMPRLPRSTLVASPSRITSSRSARPYPAGNMLPASPSLNCIDQDQDSFGSPSLFRENSMDSFSGITPSKGLRTLRLAERQQVDFVGEQAPWVEEAGKVAVSMRRNGSTIESQADAIEPIHHFSAPAQRARIDRRKWSEAELTRAIVIPATNNPIGTFTALDIQKGGMGDAPDFTVIVPAKIWANLRWAWTSSPCKFTLFLGLISSIIGGALTPTFSYFLALLLATMATPGQSEAVLRYSLAVLGLAFAEGAFSFLRYYLLDRAAEIWIFDLRKRCFAVLLEQDKTWFDGRDAGAGVLVNKLVKDAEDARNLIATSLGIMIVVAAMVTIGIVWAMATGWLLTLVGVALCPIFIGATVAQSRAIGKFEARNKARRETLAKRFYDLVSNIRGIRSMALESVFAAQFADALVATQRDALRAAPLSGFAFGLGEGLTYLAEALMFYVGAVLITRGLYTFERMVITFNLIIFTITFGAQLMAYLPGLTKSIQATADLRKLLEVGHVTAAKKQSGNTTVVSPMSVVVSSEKAGSARPEIHGWIQFRDVYFEYPTRPEVAVLQGASFEIHPGETVAIVGASGCGKSTVAALLQRLYEPTRGAIYLDGRHLGEIEVKHLRDYTAVVSQHPNLFDMSVAENVAYGSQTERKVGSGSKGAATLRLRRDLERACQLARADDFVKSLPRGYDTSMGESASLVSGGQRQRLAIARALLRILPSQEQEHGQRRQRRPYEYDCDQIYGDGQGQSQSQERKIRATILLLDEATSALDDINRRLVVETLLARGRTTEGEGGDHHRDMDPSSYTPTLASLLEPAPTINPFMVQGEEEEGEGEEEQRAQGEPTSGSPFPNIAKAAWRLPTTLLVTHKLDEMRACQRILVFDQGKVVQTGTFAQLSRQKGGVFAKLASAGEWGA